MAVSALIDELEKQFAENPRRVFARLANEYRKSGQFDRAIEICQAQIPQQPGYISGYIVLGQALFESGGPEEARLAFETALGLDPENLIALRLLGDIARQRGDVTSAQAWYTRLLEVDPQNEDVAALLQELLSTASLTTTDVTLTAATVAPSGTAAIESPPEATTVSGFGMSDDAEAGVGSGSVPESSAAWPAGAAEFGDGDQFANQVEVESQAARPPAGGGKASGVGSDDFIDVPVGDLFAGLQTEADEGSNWTADSDRKPADAVRDGDGASADVLWGHADVEPQPQEVSGIDSRSSGPSGGDDDASFRDLDLPSSQEGERASDSEMAPRSGEWQAEPHESAATDTLALQSPVAFGREGDSSPDALQHKEENLHESLADSGDRSMDNAASSPQAAQAAAPAPPFEAAAVDVPASVTDPVFATETLAELYLKQGYTREALGIYRQLIESRPNDLGLRSRAAELERRWRSGEASEVPPAQSSGEAREVVRSAESIRGFLRTIAAKKAPVRRADDTSGSSHDDGSAAPGNAAGVTTNGAAEHASLLLGASTAQDEAAARTLAAAFSVEYQEDLGAGAGQSSSEGTAERSLDTLFRDGQSQSEEPRGPQDVSFDQFFSRGAPEGAGARVPPAAPTHAQETPAAASDLEGFRAWLEGLRK